MAQSPSTNIYEILRSLGIVKHKKRQEFICDIVEGLIESRSVHFSQIAAKIKGKAKVASIERRIQDFFKRYPLIIYSWEYSSWVLCHTNE
jgi:hypothetical protein